MTNPPDKTHPAKVLTVRVRALTDGARARGGTGAWLAAAALIIVWLADWLSLSGGTVETVRNAGMTKSEFACHPNVITKSLFVLSFVSLLSASVAQLLRPGGTRPLRGTCIFAILCAFIGICWAVVATCSEASRPSLLNLSTSPLILTIALAVFAGANPGFWRIVTPLIWFVSAASAASALYFMWSQPNYVALGNSPAMFGLTTLFWGMSYLLLAETNCNVKGAIMRLLLWGITLYLAVICLARSWAIQCILVLLLWAALSQTGRAGVAGVLRVVAGFLVIFVTCGLSWYGFIRNTEAGQDWLQKLYTDDRTFQLVSFFDQVPLRRLVLGGGPSAGYFYWGNPDFQYIDNQFIFLSFKFGYAAVLCYSGAILLPALRLLLRRMPWRVKAFALIFCPFVLALMGLSVFAGLTFNFANYLVVLLAGRCSALVAISDGPPARISRYVPAARAAAMKVSE